MENILSQNPYISLITNFVKPNECEYFLNNISGVIKSTVFDNNGNSKLITQTRSSFTKWIKINTNKITQELATRIANVVNLPVENAESFQMVYYKDNGYLIIIMIVL